MYKFKRYEDASLSYTGVDCHVGENVGLYSTVVSRMDYDAMAGLLADSMRVDGQPVADEAEKREEETASVGQLQYSGAKKQQKQPAPAEAERANSFAINEGAKGALAGTGQTQPMAKPSATTAQRPNLQPTYRPAFIPPKAAVPSSINWHKSLSQLIPILQTGNPL